MSFTEVASAAIRLARDRFPMYPFMVEVLGEHLDDFKDLPGTADIFYPRGAMPPVGERFVQTDLGKTLQYLCDEEEEAASGGREAGIDAARRAFYEGDIAAAIVRQQNDEGGLMTREDLSEFRAEIEDPARATFGAYELYGCGPWCQGPMILGAAQMLSGMDLGSMGHSSVDYIHAVVEALKLSAADREAYVGDPAQIDVPLDRLLDSEYSRARRARIDPARAFPGMPPAGQLDGYEIPAWQADPSAGPGQAAANQLETSYFCVIDGEGNLFSATPSNPTTSGAVVPGLGITTSRWGSRAHTGVDHPARVGPACPPTRCSRLNRVRWSCRWDPPAVKCWAKRNCRCC